MPISQRIDYSSQYDIIPKKSNSDLWNSMDGYEIPYNQRGYVWNDKNINQFIKDIREAYTGKKKFITFGTLYFLRENIGASKSRVTIWDGQQRFISLYLLLSAICKFSKETQKDMLNADVDTSPIDNIIEEIDDYIFKKKYSYSPTEKKTFENDKLKIPKIMSVNSEDNALLKLIFNGRIHNIRNCYGTSNDDAYDDYADDKCNDDNICHENINNDCNDNVKTKNNAHGMDANNSCDHKDTIFYCKGCKLKYKDEIKMLKHVRRDCMHKKIKQYRDVYDVHDIKTVHDKDIKEEMKMEMLNAYDMFYAHVKDKFYDDVYNNKSVEFIDFMKYFQGEILHDEYICKDIECATIIFDLLNNRGKKLENIDIIRNTIIRELPDNKKKEYYEKLADITKNNELIMFTKNKEYYIKLLFAATAEEYKINDNMIKTCENIFTKKDEFEQNYNKIEKTRQILKDSVEHIIKNPHGQILILDPVFDVFQYLITPVYKKFNGINDFDKKFTDFLEILVCYQLHSSFGIRSFANSKKHYVDFSNDVFNKEKTRENFDIIINNVKILITDILLTKTQYTNFAEKLKGNFTNNKIPRIMLLYYEIKNSPNGKHLNMSKYDVEHITPKSDNLIKERHKIGNMTLLESHNSDNRQKGNRSLQNKDYKLKRPEYEKSNLKITQKIAKECDKWNVEEIEKRTEEISDFINNAIKTTLNIDESNDKSKNKIKKNNLEWDDACALLFRFCDVHKRTPCAKEQIDSYDVNKWFIRQQTKIIDDSCADYKKLSENKYVKKKLDKYLKNKQNGIQTTESDDDSENEHNTQVNNEHNTQVNDEHNAQVDNEPSAQNKIKVKPDVQVVVKPKKKKKIVEDYNDFNDKHNAQIISKPKKKVIMEQTNDSDDEQVMTKLKKKKKKKVITEEQNN